MTANDLVSKNTLVHFEKFAAEYAAVMSDGGMIDADTFYEWVGRNHTLATWGCFADGYRGKVPPPDYFAFRFSTIYVVAYQAGTLARMIYDDMIEERGT